LISTVLLAAGIGSRISGKSKPLLKLSRKAFIVDILSKLLKFEEIDEIVVVLGYQAEGVIEELIESFNRKSFKKVTIVINENYKEGLGKSIATGMFNINSDSDWVMFVPCDKPFISRNDLGRILSKMVEIEKKSVISKKGSGGEIKSVEKGIVINNYKGELVEPIGLFRNYFQRLSMLDFDIELLNLARMNDQDVEAVQINNEKALIDINTYEDYKKYVLLRGKL